MKERWIFGIVTVILGLLIAFGPLTVFPVCGAGSDGGMDMQMDDVCETEDCGDAPMVCHWTARAELGAGGLIAVLGILALLSSDERVRLGLSLAGIPAGALVILIPNALIGVCVNHHAACHSLTLPALTVIGGLYTVLNAVYAALLSRRNRSRG